MGNFEVLMWQVLGMLHKSLSMYLGLFKLLSKTALSGAVAEQGKAISH